MDKEVDNIQPCGDGCSQSLYIDRATSELDPYREPGAPVHRSQCPQSGSSCYSPSFLSPLESEERDFHPQELREATEQINEILNDLLDDSPPNRILRLITVPGGMMLTWNVIGGRVPEGAVGIDSPLQERMQMYGLLSSESEAA